MGTKSRKRIKGRIIRILDTRTVIINLGLEHGITDTSIFHILGEPEPVIDPVTQTELGRVTVAKSRVKASQVLDKFTIATTSWVDTRYVAKLTSNFLLGIAETETIKVDEGELLVKSSELQPWKAKSQSPVSLGDEVEVTIEIATEETPPENINVEDKNTSSQK